MREQVPTPEFLVENTFLSLLPQPSPEAGGHQLRRPHPQHREGGRDAKTEHSRETPSGLEELVTCLSGRE